MPQSAFIYFQSVKEITQKDWVAFCQQWKIGTLYWSDVPYSDSPPIPINTSYEGHVNIEYVKEDGTFSHRYQVIIVNDGGIWTMREKMNVLVTISREMNTELLTDEEGSNPYLFIHITPSGDVATVGVKPELYNDSNIIEIDSYYPSVFGGFATEEPLTENEEKELLKRLEKIVHEPGLQVWEVMKMQNDFSNSKAQFESLKNFSSHYFIYPSGKTNWYSQLERSELLLNQLELFVGHTGKVVCAFPANSTTIENIPGGSDSESFCVVIRPNGTERIVYKERRKSW